MRGPLPLLTLVACALGAWMLLRADAGSRAAEVLRPAALGQALDGRLASIDGPDARPERSAAGDPTPQEASDADAGVPGEWEDDLPLEEIDEGDYDQAELLADIGLPADAPVALLLGRFGPPDPLERGRASVHLELFDAADGAPVASPVVLWRLDAPGNEYWGPGDQALAFAKVPKGGRTFADLPGGEYRAVCLAERRGAPDPPSFFVPTRGGAILFLDLPGERPVRVELRARGERVERAEVHFGPLGFLAVGPFAPAWVAQRELLDPPDLLVGEMFSSSEGAPELLIDWVPVQAGTDGFDLGSFPGDRRDRRYHRRVRLRTGEGLGATISLRNDVPGDVLRLEATASDL